MKSEQPAYQNPPSLLHALPAQERGQLHVSATSLKAARAPGVFGQHSQAQSGILGLSVQGQGLDL